MNSTTTNTTERELELLACLEAALIQLREATEYIQFLEGDSSEAARQFNGIDYNVYLNQYGISVVLPK